MKQEKDSLSGTRRRFLAQMGGLFCVGCAALLGQDTEKAEPQRHKFLEDSGLNFKEVLQFSALLAYIPLMQRFAARLGKNKFLQMLQEETKGLWSERMQRVLQTQTERSLPAFFEAFRRANAEILPLPNPGLYDRFMGNAATIQIVQQTDRVMEMKVSECLFAEVYRGANAWDIGYITHCYPDFVMAGAFDPKMKLLRTKTLMRGDDCCNHRYTWEG